MGAFGIKIPKEYGGLGLSYSSYVKAMALVTSKDGSLTALLSAHQSIGLPQPLKLFGNDEQKAKYFPRLAKGAISAFALTEVDAGSDPANMHTHAEPTPDGKYFILNGEKLWCTNGTRAELFVVMARTPGRRRERQDAQADHRVHRRGVVAGRRGRSSLPLHGPQGDRERRHSIQPTCAFRARTCSGEKGRGSSSRSITLNTGRLTLPASAAGGGKALLEASRTWAEERVQWGAPIGKHEAVAQKLGMMAANTFAMEAIAGLTVGLAERGQLRHPARSGDRQDVQHGARLAHRRRRAADPRRPRLRDGGLAPRARRAADPDRARDARLAHQPDLRGFVGDHAAVHRARGGGPPLQDGVRARRQERVGQAKRPPRSAA